MGLWSWALLRGDSWTIMGNRLNAFSRSCSWRRIRTDACAPSDESATWRHVAHLGLGYQELWITWSQCQADTDAAEQQTIRTILDSTIASNERRTPSWRRSLYVILIISDGPQGLGILTVCVAIKIMQKECYKTHRYYYSLVIVKLQSNTTWNKKQWPVSPYPRSSVSFHLSSYHFRVRPQSETGQVCKILSHGRLSIALCLLSTGKGHKWVRSLNNHCSMWTLTRTGLW